MKGLKGPLWQISIGLWLGMAVFLGIVGRSWQAFAGYLAFAAFFIGAGLAAEAARSQRKPLRILGKIGCIAAALVIVGAVLNTAERLYLVNADSYPRFLARNLGTADMHTIDRLRANECKDHPVEVFEKKNYTWVMRCGFSWIDGHTYISNADPFRELRKERAQ